MSPNDKTASGAELEGPVTDSVFDFIYHDVRRIGSFLAQIDPSGHLTSLKQTETAESGSGMKSSANVTGNVVVARGGAAIEDQQTAAERETLERTYDPLWTNARALLDMLDERGMIQAGVNSARIGQFVKVTGHLAITDLTLWKGLWSLPALKEVISENAAAEHQAAQAVVPSQSQNRRARRQANATKSSVAPKSAFEHQIEAGLALVGMLPHTIQARLASKEGTVWCSLKEDGLVVSASDLTLKHGITVAGLWTMVGVLDALPEIDTEGEPTQSVIQEIINSASLTASPFSDLMQRMTPAIRGLLGRPHQAWGITPVVIFRNVAG